MSMYVPHGSFRSPAILPITLANSPTSISVKSLFCSTYAPLPPIRRSIIEKAIGLEISIMQFVSITSSSVIPILIIDIIT